MMKNKSAMQLTTYILPEKLKRDDNFGNHLSKYSAYTFYFKLKYCNPLYNFFLERFEKVLTIYPEGH